MLNGGLGRWLAGFVVTCGLIWTAAAAQIATGSISGQAVDEAGNGLPGVLVTARGADTGLERSATTDESGNYRILALPPAAYEIRATLSGYGTQPRNLVVNVGQVVVLNLEMIPRFQETVVVTAVPTAINTTKPEISTVVTEEQIRSYPLINRDFTDLARLAPGVKQSPAGQFDPTKKEGVYTPFTTGGTAGRNVNISIDGADNNDNVVGFFTMGMTMEAIQEFEVIQDQYKAEYGRSLGGVVNVITKSGNNEFGGSVFGIFRNEDMRAKSYSERLEGADKVESDREQYGFSVGGPILKDKLFYFVAAERQSEERPVALSSLITDFSGTEPAGFPFRIATPGTVVPQDFERDMFTVRLDWNISSRHRIFVRYAGDDIEFLNDQGGTITDPSQQGDSQTDIWSAVLNWQWIVGKNAINEVIVHKNDFENQIVSNSPDESLSLFFDSIWLGRNQNTPQATFEEKSQFRDDFSWGWGNHSFKAGVEIIEVDLDEGTLGRPTNPSVWFFFNPTVTPSGSMVSGDGNTNGVDDGIEAIDNVTLVGPALVPATDYTQYGVYFQDDWQVNDRWRLHLGLRIDRDDGIFEDTERGANRGFYECLADPGNSRKCGLDPAVPAPPNAPQGIDGFENTFPEDPTNISPRIGFVYRVGGGDTDVIRGSWGLFYDKLIDNVNLFMRQNLSPYRSPSLPSLAGCDVTTDPTCSATELLAGETPVVGYPALPADFTLANYENRASGLRSWVDGLTAVQGPATFNDFVLMPSPDWKTPYTSAFSVGWGHVFNDRLSLDSNFIYRRGFHQMTVDAYGGGASGRESPFPVVVDPNTGLASYPGEVDLLATEGKSQYVALQTSLHGRFERIEFTWNLNISQARGTQDNGGAYIGGGPLDIFDGGNLTYTGGNIDSEWGVITGDQAIYTNFYGVFQLPFDFRAAANIVYGSATYFQPFSGLDTNGDGFNGGIFGLPSEYTGSRGAGEGDDYFNIDLRIAKFFGLPSDMNVEVYLDVFNLLNRVNHGPFEVRQQLIDVGGGVARLNPDFGRPTGMVVSPSRTVQLGVRYTF